jgi:hypothetical protein
VQIKEIDGSDAAGLRSLSLAKADLVGAGISLNGYLGLLAIGDIGTGAALNLAGPAPAKPKNAGTWITAGVIGDGTAITSAAPISSLTAVAVGDGTITAPRVGAIKVTGRKAGAGRPAVAGNFGADLTVGAVDPAKGTALGSLKVAGAVTGSTIRVGGSVGLVSVGSFVGSRLFAGYTGPDTGIGGAFDPSVSVGPFRVTAKSGGFADSLVVASRFKNVALASAVTGNGGTPFGFVFHDRFGGLAVNDPKLTYDRAKGGTQLLAGNLEVRQA